MKDFNSGKRVTFHPCGTDERILRADLGTYTNMRAVLDGKVKPNKEWRKALLSFLLHNFKDSIEFFNRRVDAYFLFRHKYEYGTGNEYLDSNIKHYRYLYTKYRPEIKDYLLKEFNISLDPTPEQIAERE